jgi:hypothetical protein
MINLYKISPEYPRIAHLDKNISNMTHDDIVLDVELPFEGYVQEKVDGSNIGVSWVDSAVLRNRNKVLRKGYIKKDTPAKLQFRPAWNWIHEHKKDIQYLSEKLMSPITIYGEWMVAQHSIHYDKLPDWFLAFDIYVVEDRKFLSTDLFEELMSNTKISLIKSKYMKFNSVSEIVMESELPSEYRDGIREGIVIKQCKNGWIDETFKIVNSQFTRREDFNSSGLIKNKLK